MRSPTNTLNPPITTKQQYLNETSPAPDSERFNARSLRCSHRALRISPQAMTSTTYGAKRTVNTHRVFFQNTGQYPVLPGAGMLGCKVEYTQAARATRQLQRMLAVPRYGASSTQVGAISVRSAVKFVLVKFQKGCNVGHGIGCRCDCCSIKIDRRWEMMSRNYNISSWSYRFKM